MATGIRFPADLRVPDRDGYGDTFEEIRSAFEPEIGQVRRRNRMRSAPRVFDLQWVLNQADYQIFDVWWQNTIKGGEQSFDIQLLDDDHTLVWYTVHALGEYKAEVVHELEWRVTLRVRALGDNFGSTRPAGTDELKGRAAVGVVRGTGAIKVTRPIRGTTSVGVTASGRLAFPAMRGSTTVGMYRLPRGTLAPIPMRGSITIGLTATGKIETGVFISYPEQSRQWMNLDWLGSVQGQDINTNAAAVSREWMEI